MTDDALAAELERTLENVECPCAAGLNRGIGVVDMGLIQQAERVGNVVEIGLQLTEPACIYGLGIAEEIESAIKAGDPSVEAVRITFLYSEEIWSEDRLSAAARERLAFVRRQDVAFTVKQQARIGH